MSFLTRFLPGLLPGVSAFLNPWVLLGLFGALVGAFFYGLHEGHKQLESYQEAVKKTGEAQEQIVASWKQQRTNKTKEVEGDWAHWTVDLQQQRDDALARLRKLASSGSVPTVSQTPGAVDPSGNDIVCYAKGKFDAAMGRFIRSELESTPKITDRGDSYLTVAKFCSAWTIGQWKLDPASQGK